MWEGEGWLFQTVNGASHKKIDSCKKKFHRSPEPLMLEEMVMGSTFENGVF